MKNNITLFISIFLLLAQLQAQTQIPNYVPTNGLVGWWPFNGNANDESGNGNNGVVINPQTTLTTDRNGNNNSAYTFVNSTQSGIQTTSNVSINSTSISASLWFNPSSNLTISSGQKIFISGNGNVPIQFTYNNGGICIEWCSNQGVVQHTAPMSFNANTWYHVAFSGAVSSNLKVYINGIEYITSTTANNLRTMSNGSLLFGISSSSSWPSPFNGKIDDIGIWNRALTQQEITNLYQTQPFNLVSSSSASQISLPNYVQTNGLVGWWPFNGNANDESGNGYNGVVINSQTNLTTDRNGNNNSAYTFVNSTQSGIQTTSNVSINSTSISASLWFNPSSNLTISSGQKILISGTGNVPIQFTYNNGGICIEWWSNQGVVQHTVPMSFNANTWYHVAFSGAVSSDLKVYINGIEYITSTTANSLRSMSNGSLLFGISSSSSWPSPFNGKIDDIGMWNRTLTQQEITQLYQAQPFNAGSSSTGICAGQPVTLSVNAIAGTITGLTCASSTNNGTLISGVMASGVSSTIPYLGGNGGTHNGQTVTSSGVTGLTATLIAGTFASGNGSLTYTITGTPSANGTASFALSIGGQTCALSRTVVAGTISALTCASATNNGTLTAGVLATGVNSVVPYTGGNGGTHNGQTVVSTGITGLTATLTAGSFANGTGSLNYIITGTPNTSGTASFALNIGGQTCTLTRTVATLVSQYPTGSVFCTANPTAIVNVTNPTTGRIWMDRNLGATQVATSSTDANAYGDLYQWGRKSDGHQCRTSTTTSTLSSSDIPGNSSFILAPNTPNDWRSPQNNNLWQGLNGVNNPCPSGYRIPNSTELNNEVNSWSAITTLDAFNSVLKFPAAGSRHASFGTLNNVGGNVTLWTSTVQSISSLGLGTGGGVINSQNRSRGQSVRCIKEIDGSIGALNCGSSTLTGNLISGTAASGVSVSIPYTGGNGGFYAAQSVSSTGVTGLTASIAQGLFTSSTGSLVYTITGTPSTSGTASFALNIGGQSCTLSITVYPTQPSYPAGSVFCNGITTLVIDVTNPTTGKTWMDRNLGASQAATSSTDANSYGDLYQWGRRSDGHQCRNSLTTSALSSTDQPGHGNFILAPNSPGDWRNPQNTNLWQGVNGVNNPCPSGYRLPSETELNTERLSWNSYNSFGAYTSPLKLPMTGDRGGASLSAVGTGGYYWSQTISSTASLYLLFYSTDAFTLAISRSFGISVRCIKD